MPDFNIPNSQSHFSDEGIISRDWFLFLLNLFDANGGGIVGTTTQVLHGGGAGFGQVNLVGDVTGILPSVNGGTGVNNGVRTVTLGGNLTTGGAFTTTPNNSVTFNTVGATSVSLPTSGTLITSVVLTGDVFATGTNTGVAVATITANAITNSKLAQMAARTIKGNNTVSTANPTDIAAGQFPATQTNDSASAGNLGEYISGSVASGAAVPLTNATPANVLAVALTAGDWDVAGQVDYTVTGATTTDFRSGASTTSAAFGVQDTFSNLPLIAAGLTDFLGHVIPTSRISVTNAITVTAYLVSQTNFSLGSAAAYGTLRARRMR